MPYLLNLNANVTNHFVHLQVVCLQTGTNILCNIF